MAEFTVSPICRVISSRSGVLMSRSWSPSSKVSASSESEVGRRRCAALGNEKFFAVLIPYPGKTAYRKHYPRKDGKARYALMKVS